MKTYSVSLPIAGHLVVSVQAENEDDAIKEAIDKATLDDLEYWEALDQFIRGNVCYCPHPWSAKATLEDDGEE